MEILYPCPWWEKINLAAMHLTDELINITLAGTNGSQVHDLGAVSLRHRGNSDRVFVDIYADEECAKLRHS